MRARQFWFLCTAALSALALAACARPSTGMIILSSIAATLLIASITFIVIRSRHNSRWPFVALPIILIASAGTVITLMSSRGVRLGTIALVAISLGIYTDALLATRHKHNPAAIPDNRLLYTLGHLALLAVFFSSSGMAALSTFFNLPMAFLVVVFTWMIYIAGRGFTESVPHLDLDERWGAIVLLVVAMVQVFIALVALPIHFIAIGGLAAVVFYCLSGITRTVTLGLLNRSIITRYLTASIIAITIIMAAAQWI